METLEQINEVIKNYNDLQALVEEKVAILEIIDNKYNTAKGIEEIKFEDDNVYVTCDNTCMGCYDSLSFSFPLVYLTLSDEKLKEVAKADMLNRIEKQRIENEQKDLKEKQKTEEYEKEQYLKLKAKFES